MGQMNFVYRRTIRLQDTDAAGVVYFASLLSICHEAYEAALIDAGIDLKGFFKSQLAIPIVHAEADYFQPMFCGEEYQVEVLPAMLGESKFKIQYEIRSAEQLVGQASTVHLCIDVASRCRQPLPAAIQQWLHPIKP